MWNGNIRLVIIFWVYYTALGLMIEELLFNNIYESKDLPLILTLLFFYSYNLFMFKSVWSSSNTYMGRKVWILLTKTILILDILSKVILLPLRLLRIEIF